MAMSKYKNLSDEDLEKKYQNLKQTSKGVSIAFIVILLFAIGYSGYANAKNFDTPFSTLPILLILFAGQKAVFYAQMSPIFKEITQRKNSNQK